jgi:hypothetical protein
MSHKGFSHIGLSTPHLDKTCEFCEVKVTVLSRLGVLKDPPRWLELEVRSNF